MDTEDGSGTSSGSGGFTVSGFGDPDTPLTSVHRVPSSDMDDNDKDVTGEIDVPVPLDEPEPRPAKSDPGFDGWLDDDQDPYAALTDEDDDAAAEIADWMAFTSGGDEPEPAPASSVAQPSPEPPAVVESEAVEEVEEVAIVSEAPVVPEPELPTIEPSPEPPEAVVPETPVVSEAPEPPSWFPLDDEADETEAPAPVVEAVVVEAAAAVPPPPEDAPSAIEEEASPDDPDDDHDDTAEFFLGQGDEGETDLEDLELWSQPDDDGGAPTPPAVTPPSALDFPIGEGPATDGRPDDSDRLDVIPVVPAGMAAAAAAAASGPGGEDTGEIPITSPAPLAPGTSAVFDYEQAPDDDLTSDQYLHAATREHHELAAAVAAARAGETEQVAVSAAIPGLESAVVGFDDVVAPSEVGTAPIAKPPPSDLLMRVGTGVALVLAFGLSLVWRPAIIVLALAVFVIAAGEFYSALIHRHYKPLSIFGFLGIVGAGLGTVVWGVVAIPIALVLMITVLLLFNAVSNRRQGSVSGFSLTILVAAWIGGFGAFAFPIIESDDYRALVITVVAMVALVDIAAYGVGRSIGRRPFAPTISPKKTIEGFLGGTLMALVAGSVASFFVAAIDLPAGLVLGVVVAIFAPLGDLAVSVVKRSLDIKDMGSILPGHGGLLDRIDAIIAVIPAAWAALVWLGIL